MSGWIRVTDMLPETGKSVLCYCNHTNVFQNHIRWKRINIGEMYNRTDFIMDSDDTTFINVTHWMPLPEIPTDL